MIDKNRIKGLIFDYGGTIDSNGLHWSEVIWKGYESERVVLDKDKFRDAYVFAERKLGKNPIIKPYHNFQDMKGLPVTSVYLSRIFFNEGPKK